jgi:hypothetical protein
MKLQMKREALMKLNRQANETQLGFDTRGPTGFCYGFDTAGWGEPSAETICD